MKFKTYKGETLHDATVTLKIDGVRAHRSPEGVVSRAGKPLHNITLPEGVEVAEVFLGSWEDTVSAVRSHKDRPVPASAVYSLVPNLDGRLVSCHYESIGDAEVKRQFEGFRKQGYEGLVIYAAEGMFKVKGTETFDVPVTEVIPGKGKHEGRMGALMTTMGRVGTGFTDAMRELDWPVGCVIEVECMELTPQGKFRHPRFIRRRVDKETLA